MSEMSTVMNLIPSTLCGTELGPKREDLGGREELSGPWLLNRGMLLGERRGDERGGFEL